MYHTKTLRFSQETLLLYYKLTGHCAVALRNHGSGTHKSTTAGVPRIFLAKSGTDAMGYHHFESRWHDVWCLHISC